MLLSCGYADFCKRNQFFLHTITVLSTELLGDMSLLDNRIPLARLLINKAQDIELAIRIGKTLLEEKTKLQVCFEQPSAIRSFWVTIRKMSEATAFNYTPPCHEAFLDSL